VLMVRPSSLLMVSATQSNDVSYIVIIHIAAKACFHHHHHQNRNTLLSKGCRACLCMSMQHIYLQAVQRMSIYTFSAWHHGFQHPCVVMQLPAHTLSLALVSCHVRLC